MDKRVMIVKLLLVAVYIISECDCDMLSLDKAMCPDYEKAVILIAVQYGVTLKDNPNIPDIVLHSLVVYGTVEKAERSDADGNKIYSFLHEVTFKEGLYQLNISNLRITMRFPSSEMLCGHTFPDHSDGYIIAGRVGSDGILYSDMCQYAQLSREVLAVEDNVDLLNGRRKPSCGRGDS